MSAAPQTIGRNPLRVLLRIPVPWVFVLTYLVGVVLEYLCPLGVRAIKTLPGIGIAGGVVFCIGMVLAAWGWVTFRKARTTTVPGRASSQFVTWGPYRFCRNPMYVGLTIMYLGEAGIQRQLWPIVLLPLTLIYVNWIVIPVEEAKLREVFGDAYTQYCRRVKRWV